MSVYVRAYSAGDISVMREIWNEVVCAGNAFPQTEPLKDDVVAESFFASQTYCGVAMQDDEVCGLYILHPNNVGRCAHVANASYAVSSSVRGHGVGACLVKDSLLQADASGFRGLQFNAVVASNTGAIHLYEKLGFVRIGTIPGGFHNAQGIYEDMFIFYHPTECVS